MTEAEGDQSLAPITAFRFHVQPENPDGGLTRPWIPATREGVPVVCEREELLAGSPVEPYELWQPHVWLAD